jgi:tape measure domain-containing protein
MSEYRLAIVIDANGRPALQAIDRVSGATRSLGGAQQAAAAGADRMAQASRRADGEMQQLGATARRVQGFLLAVFGAAVIRDVVQTTLQIDGMKRTLEGVLGSGQAAAAGIAFVRAETDRLGIAFTPALEGFTKLTAAATGTPLAPRVQELTSAVLQAGRAFNLAPDQIGGAITALEQMISKGTVSAEELKGQLGERLPGAFQIAARAMGVTTAELSKMLEKGEVVATDFLPRFAAELSRATEASSRLAAAGPSAELARIGNELDQLKADIGTGFFDGLGDGLSEVREQLAGFNAAELGREIGQALGQIARNIDTLTVAVVAFASAQAVGAAVTGLRALLGTSVAVPASIAAAGAAFQGLSVPIAGATSQITGWTRAATVATTVGRGLFTLIGGWPGVLTLAAVGMYELASGQSQAEKSAQALRQATDALRNSTEQTRESALANLKITRDQTKADLDAAEAQLAKLEGLRALRAAGPGMSDVGPGERAFQGGFALATSVPIDKLEQDIDKLRRSVLEADAAVAELTGGREQLEQFFATFQQSKLATRLLKALGIEMKKVQQVTAPAAVGGGGSGKSQQIKETERYIQSLQREIATLGMSRAEQIRYEAAQRASKASTRAQAEEILRLGDTLARKVDELDAATEAERRAEEASRRLAEANRELEQATAASAGAFAQLEEDLAIILGGPIEQIMAQYRRAIEIIEEYRELQSRQIMQFGPVPDEAWRELDERLARAARKAAQVADEGLREVARRAGNDFENVFRSALEDGFDSASLSSFWAKIKEGWQRAIEEGGAQGALNFAVGAANMLQGAVGAYQGAGGGARGVSAALAQLPIPYVQQIAQIANAIDAIAGGRLFGTDWSRESATREFSIREDGQTSGSSTERQVRQRSLFRGRQWRNRTTQLSGDSLDAINDLVESAQQALAGAARAVGAELPQLLAFGFRQEFDKDGNLIREVATIAGQQFNEGLEEAAQRFIGANILTLLESIDPALSALSARFASTGSEALDFAQAMLAAQIDIRQGMGLLQDGTLTEIGELMTSLRNPGEALIETYARLRASSDLYRQALGIMDGALVASSAEVVAFAAGAIDALGGLDAAAQQLNVVLTTFFTDAERATFRLQDAQSRISRLSGELGVAGVNEGNFRSRFEAARAAGLTPEEFARWVQLGVAIADGAQAARDYAAAIGVVTEETNDLVVNVTDLGEASQELNRALEALGVFAGDISAELQALRREGTDEFVSGVQDVEAWVRDSTARAHELARAAGRQAASEETLAQIREIAAIRMGRAILALERATVGLIEQLYAAVDAAEAVDGPDLTRSNDPLAFVALLARGFEEIEETVAAIDPQRYQQALEIARNLFNLQWATGDDALDIGERLGLPFDRFLRDLGIDLAALTDAANFDGLVQAARTLGVELPALAARVGVDIGSLADAGSLLNDAFERVLGQLNEGQRGPIESLLRQLETAAPADRGALLTQLGELVNQLPANLRALFAPLLDDVDVTPPEVEMVAVTERVEVAVNAGNTLLSQILAAIERDTVPKPGRGDGLKIGESQSAKGGIDIQPLATTIDAAKTAQVSAINGVSRDVIGVQAAVARSQTVLEQLLEEFRRAEERRSVRGMA